MTTFFNKKEEVIDIELTPLGEALLSVGRLKPHYYAFFDEDVLYDANGAASIIEDQNDIETRIQSDTPKLKTQVVFDGIETNLRPLIQSSRISDSLEPGDNIYDVIPPNIDRNFSIIEPLGSMALGSKNAPAWDIKVLKGELSGAINYLTGSRSSGLESDVKRIAQLEFDIEYRVVVGNINEIDYNGEIAEQGRIMSPIYDDGTFLYLDDDPQELILAIDEENSAIDLDYDMEVFAVQDLATEEAPTLTPLHFLKPDVEIKDGILLDKPIQQSSRALDSSFAEYFFLINCDTQIPSEDICPVLGDIRPRGVTLREIPFECPDVQRSGRFDIYGTNIAEEDPCDD